MQEFSSVGDAWVFLLDAIVRDGTPMGGEGLELLGVSVAFPAAANNDPILQRFGDPTVVAEMRKVFFGAGSGELNHSYASLMRGPGGRNDLEDVIALLRAEPWSKRAVLMLCGEGDGKVPCVNAVQFLLRDALRTIYFARGQDAFRKFYADALCVADMARRVAAGLGAANGSISAFIGSCHVYRADQPAVDQLLRDARPCLHGSGGRISHLVQRPPPRTLGLGYHEKGGV
jgi:hypothetical protein